MGKLYIAVTKDKYELPIAVADSAAALADARNPTERHSQANAFCKDRQMEVVSVQGSRGG